MNVLIVAGERSAENYASILVDELKQLDQTINFFSVSSDLLKDKTQKIADYRDISIIGVKEAVSVAKNAFFLLKRLKGVIINQPIDMVILMDFPEFNMKLMKIAKKLKRKVVYYISPQVWAWRSYRVKTLFEYSDIVVPILPFEKTFFKIKGVNKDKVYYNGHPIVDLLHTKLMSDYDREDIILIMPGSRKGEIEYNYRPMFEAARELRTILKGFRFIWAIPDNIDREFVSNILSGYEFIEVTNDSHSAMTKAKFGILKSGTTTLEATLFNLPMVVSYKLSKTSYYLGRLLINGIKYIALPNLIFGGEVVKELIEDKATKENIVQEILRLHKNKELYNNMINKLKNISFILGEYPVTKNIASKIYDLI